MNQGAAAEVLMILGALCTLAGGSDPGTAAQKRTL